MMMMMMMIYIDNYTDFGHQSLSSLTHNLTIKFVYNRMFNLKFLDLPLPTLVSNLNTASKQ